MMKVRQNDDRFVGLKVRQNDDRFVGQCPGSVLAHSGFVFALFGPNKFVSYTDFSFLVVSKCLVISITMFKLILESEKERRFVDESFNPKKMKVDCVHPV